MTPCDYSSLKKITLNKIHFDSFKKLKNLETVSFHDCDFVDISYKEVSTFIWRVKNVSFVGCKWASFNMISCQHWETLHVENCVFFNGHNLKYLRKLKKLSLKAVSLHSLTSTTLERLELTNVKLNRDFTCDLPNLKELTVTGMKGKEVWSHVKGCHKMEKMIIMGCDTSICFEDIQCMNNFVSITYSDE